MINNLIRVYRADHTRLEAVREWLSWFEKKQRIDAG